MNRTYKLQSFVTSWFLNWSLFIMWYHVFIHIIFFGAKLDINIVVFCIVQLHVHITIPWKCYISKNKITCHSQYVRFSRCVWQPSLSRHPVSRLTGPLIRDAGPALTQYWFNVLCLPEAIRFANYILNVLCLASVWRLIENLINDH